MGWFSNFYHDWMRPILGGRDIHEWEKQSVSLQTVELKNEKLSQELENACNKAGGFLTYSEYVEIEQFGANGYHSTHKHHGFTPSFKIWKNAVFQYITRHNIHEIIELGPGNGYLAEDLLNICEKNHFGLTWNAVEIEDNFRENIQKRFGKEKYKKFVGDIVKTIDKLPYYNTALIISSYCIDSIPPEIFVNTKNTITYPESIIGIRVKNNVLTEFILNQTQLHAKHFKIEKGICIFNGISFDLSSWKLAPMQRAYIILKGFKTLYDTVAKVKHPTLLTIDEVRTSQEVLRSDHFLSPLYLSIKNRYRFNPETGYKRAGELLYYYPIFLSSILSTLKSMGLTNITYDNEQKLAAILENKTWIPDKRYRYFLCYGFLAKGTPKMIKKITVSFPEDIRL